MVSLSNCILYPRFVVDSAAIQLLIEGSQKVPVPLALMFYFTMTDNSGEIS